MRWAHRTRALAPTTLVVLVLAAACGGDEASPETEPAAIAAPAWLGEAGLVVRPPVPVPLHELCGLASNPDDLPVGDDARSTAMRRGYFDAARDLGGVMIRRDFLWHEIEPSRGTFDFRAYDRFVAEANA